MEELSNTAISNVLADGEDSVERVDIEAAVKDGSLSVEQGLGQMQRQLERQFADLERRLSANGSSDTTSLISRMLARHTEAPSDSLSVCFNTVAILFLLDVDNMTFDYALPEKLRAVVEEFGHVELNQVQADALARTKQVHIVLVVVAVCGVVALGGFHGRAAQTSNLAVAVIAFFVGKVVEAFDGERSATEIAKEVAKTAGAAAVGFIARGFLFEISRGWQV